MAEGHELGTFSTVAKRSLAGFGAVGAGWSERNFCRGTFSLTVLSWCRAAHFFGKVRGVPSSYLTKSLNTSLSAVVSFRIISSNCSGVSASPTKN